MVGVVAPPWPSSDAGLGLAVPANSPLVVTVDLPQGSASEVRAQLNQPGQDYGNVEEDITKLKLFPLSSGTKSLTVVAPTVPGRYSFYVCVIDGWGRWYRTGTRRYMDVQ